jgi:hypothetical protein
MGRKCTCPSFIIDLVAKGRKRLRDHLYEIKSGPLVVVTSMKLFQESEEGPAVALLAECTLSRLI